MSNASEAAPSEATAPPGASSPRSVVGRATEWVTRAQALEAAHAEIASQPARSHVFHRRSRLALEVANRTLDPVDPLRSGSGAAIAIGLYAQSAYWALRALRSTAEDADPAALWDACESDVTEAAGGEARSSRLRELMVSPDVHALYELSDEPATELAVQARELATRLVERVDRPEKLVGALLVQRAIRVGLVLLLVSALIGLGILGASYATRKPDIARGKPWRTSSQYVECHPDKKECGGAETSILFHTHEEMGPWFEIDLGAPTRFTAVTVKNRADFGPERAVPLVVEVGTDQKTFKEVARRTDVFSTWTAKFAPQDARYVRVRVPRKTILHLEKVSVHP